MPQPAPLRKLVTCLFTSLVNIVSISLLFGCAGGGSSTPPPPPPNPAPTITSISPSSLTEGATATTVTVNGTGFIQSSTVLWNQSARPTTYVSSSELQAAIPVTDLAVAGTAQIVVSNPSPGGGASGAATLTINNPIPQVTSISPNTVTLMSSGTVVTLTGSGFVSNSSVMINGIAHASNYVNASQIQLTLQPGDVATVGAIQISVVNPAPGGGAATPNALNVVNPAPAINSLNPASITQGSTPSTLTITGTGFLISSVVQFNTGAHASNYVNSTTITVPLTANDLATPATIQITVVNGSPGGGASAPFALNIANYSVPALTGITPATIFVNFPDTPASIQGSGFSASSTVYVNGNSLTITGWDAADVYFTLPAADLTSVGTLSFTVSNPGTQSSNAVTIDVLPNPAPVLTGIASSSAAVGGPAFTINVSGSNFVPSSVVQWNGSPRATTYINSNQLTAMITATDIQSPGNFSVTILNPVPGGGLSSPAIFTTYIGLSANDLVYNPVTLLLYASVPSAGGPSLGNSIVPIDPFTGGIGTPIFVGSEPNKMALSSDGTVIWVSLDGADAVREVNLTTQSAGLQFSLGGGTGVYNPPVKAQALAVLPGSPQTIAVSTPIAYIYSSTVVIYDSGVARPNGQTSNINCCSGVVGLAFDSTGTKLYEAGSGYGLAQVGSSGISSASELNANVNTNDLDVDNGRAYLTNGDVLDANTGLQLGVFSVAPSQNANGPVVADSVLGKGFVLVNPNFGSNYQINAYDLSTFVLNGSLPVGGVNSFYRSPTSLRRWGQDGLAFTTGSQVYILRSPVVRDLSTSLADLSVTSSVPASVATGTNLTYQLTIANAGPVAATPATLIDNIHDGASLQSVVPSQGNCGGAAVIYCNLGSLNSGKSATVQITITPLSPGPLTNTASVSAPQGDPNPANNTVVSTTNATGSVYSALPTITSISPAFVQTGSSTFTLTVNGSGFVSGSVVQLNSTPLPTAFVSETLLTATVDASDVTSLGWGWINVTSPLPGGGTSSRLPLTTYNVISLDVNRFSFDPFTRKLYASVPSTATQVQGNSLVSIDPLTGSLGSPLQIGSEPNRVAESSDGQYLYIGLDGSKSLTRVDLTTQTQGPVYPFILPGTSPASSFAARDLAVAPGNDNLLAVDPGYASSGVGIVDISGSTATMRPIQAGIYTGSNITFPNATTVYTYDSDTTGAEFYRWAITSNGLSLENNTGYTINGIGGFAGGYELVNGLVYGFSGGVADPTTTPPTQLGQFSVSSAQGSGQSIEGSGVAADPTLGRVFFLGETLAGSANPVLLSFDSSRYVMLGMQQYTGAAQGIDLLRWGRDGLAWHSTANGAFGNSTPGSGQVFVMRGPFVLQEWYTTNPTPTLTSASPASAVAGSGNFMLTITGSNFVPGAVVLWNGTERSTTFVDPSHLKVAIPASDVAKSGAATLSVNNPGSNNSNSNSFAIN